MAMAGSKEWHAEAKPIAHLCEPLVGRRITLSVFEAKLKAVLEVVRQHPSHKVCSSSPP